MGRSTVMHLVWHTPLEVSRHRPIIIDSDEDPMADRRRAFTPQQCNPEKALTPRPACPAMVTRCLSGRRSPWPAGQPQRARPMVGVMGSNPSPLDDPRNRLRGNHGKPRRSL